MSTQRPPKMAITTFFDKFRSLESKQELFTAIALYVMLALFITASIDKYIDKIFDKVEQLFPAINPLNKVWIYTQVVIQLFLVVLTFFIIKSIIDNLVYTIGKRGPGFGMFDRNKVGTVIFAFVLFFGQSNLKEKMKLLVPNL